MLSQYARRVDQLDAVCLDSELFSLLNAQFRKSFIYFPSSFIVKAGPELDALFRFIFKYLPLEYLGATFGQNVFELKYFDSKRLHPASKYKLRLLTVLTICLPWFWDRILRRIIENYSQNKDSRRIVKATYSIESKFLTLWKMLSLINFCVFLQRSEFSTLTERFLQMRPLYTASQDIKTVQYSGISREILWHGLDEFLGFTLPLINIYRIKNYAKRFWLSCCKRNTLPTFKRKNFDCSICGSIPNFPHTIGCEHLFCYYCIASMLLVDPTFVCIDCDFSANGINSIKPLPINKPTCVV